MSSFLTRRVSASSTSLLSRLGLFRHLSNAKERERSSIVLIGLNVHSTPVEMREKMVIPIAECPGAITKLCTLDYVEEAAVLSTCNRTEIYFVASSPHEGAKEVTRWLSEVICFH